MKCIIPGLNVKVLARAIQSLAKIGDELYIEPEDDGISLRSVNGSRSAYATFTFSKIFFSFYKKQNTGDDGEVVKCKISMKSCLPVFRSPVTLDKQVETCLIHLEPDGTRLIFEFRCRHNVIKTHYMPIIECESLQAVYPLEDVPNKLIIDAKVLADAVHNFQLTQEEISLSVSTVKAHFKSYNDEVVDRSKVINTELCLEPREFENYCVGCEASITFCLKELRSISAFAEATSLPVCINFKESGQPVVFVIRNIPAFEAHFVLATLSVAGDSQSQISQMSRNSVKSSKSKKKTASGSKSPSKHDLTRESIQKVPVPEGPLVRAKATNVIDPAQKIVQRRGKEDSEGNRKNGDDALNAEDIFQLFSDDTEPLEGCSQKFNNENHKLQNGKSSSECASKHTRNHKRRERDLSENSIDSYRNHESLDNNCGSETEDDLVPSSPKSPALKKARYVFKRCFEATFNPETIPGYDVVLADDSAGESD